MSTVYGRCVEPARGAFIAWLRNLQISDTDNWLNLGDFNFYRSTENRNRPGGNISDTIVFNEAIGESGLIELPLKGRAFTWRNMQQNPLLEHLDWFFTLVNWTTIYPNTEVLPMAKPISDHIPCKVMIGTSIPKVKSSDLRIFGLIILGFLMLYKIVGPLQEFLGEMQLQISL